jgi:nitroimidazol reductase NimA-like FMN-containing flavoprotein (pyridoxamine 5'-phosphate oxidase superfamily)
MAEPNEPRASRPHIPGYGIPDSTDELLPWSHVTERLERARNYWIATVPRDGRPHVVPVQGAWIDGVLYWGGGPDVLWARNLRRDPRVAVHLESGDDAVIVEGTAELRHPEAGVATKIQDAYERKYGYRHPLPFWTLVPRVAFAWTQFERDPTRWRFD